MQLFAFKVVAPPTVHSQTGETLFYVCATEGERDCGGDRRSEWVNRFALSVRNVGTLWHESFDLNATRENIIISSYHILFQC